MNAIRAAGRYCALLGSIFLAYVGMSLDYSTLLSAETDFPRICGVEPVAYDRTCATIYRYLHRQGRAYTLRKILKNTTQSCTHI